MPVGEPNLSDHGDLLAGKNSYLFSRAAIDNADALSSASKRNDAQFLHDINSKIVSAPFSQPAVRPIRRSHVQPPSSPALARRSSIAVSSVLRPPLVTDDDAADVDFEVKRIAPLTNRLSRYGTRSTSVPPPLTSSSSSSGFVQHPFVVGRRTVFYDAGRGYDHYDHPGGRVILIGDDPEFYHAPTVYDVEVQPTPSFQKLNPVADLAVRQAHRNLDRIEREIHSSGDVIYPRAISPRPILYTTTRDGPFRRSLSYHGPRSSSLSTVGTRSPSPARRAPSAAAPPGRRLVRTTYRTSNDVDDDLYDYLSPTKLDNRDIKTELLLSGTYPGHHYAGRSYYPSSVTRPTAGSSGLSGALLYDLHLNSPGDLARIPAATSSNILTKFSSGPSSSYHVTHSAAPHTFSHHSLSAPYVAPTTSSHSLPRYPVSPVPVRQLPPSSSSSSAAHSSTSGLPPVVRPKVSETRRKVRDVLCKVKGDPHYFDD